MRKEHIRTLNLSTPSTATLRPPASLLTAASAVAARTIDNMELRRLGRGCCCASGAACVAKEALPRAAGSGISAAICNE